MSEYDGLIGASNMFWDEDRFENRKKNLSDVWENENISQKERKELIALLVAYGNHLAYQ